MKKLHRAALSVALAVLAAPVPAQRPLRSQLCTWREPPPLSDDGPSEDTKASYAGGIAFAVGGLGLLTRAKRR